METTLSQGVDEWIAPMADSMDELATCTLRLGGATVEPCGAAVPRGLVGAYVGLVGDTAALQLGVVADHATCAALARALLCMEAEEQLSDEDMADAMNEVANIVGGGVKRRMVDIDPSLKLGLPVFINGFVQPTHALETAAATVALGPYDAHLLILRHRI